MRTYRESTAKKEYSRLRVMTTQGLLMVAVIVMMTGCKSSRFYQTTMWEYQTAYKKELNRVMSFHSQGLLEWKVITSDTTYQIILPVGQRPLRDE
jgi:hypothetical protein